MSGPIATPWRPCDRARRRSLMVFCLLALFGAAVPTSAQTRATAPVIVVETVRGSFEIDTYPADAPKTVAHIVALVKQGFYDGQRIHRALPGFLVQWGDPRSRDTAQEAAWGRGPAASSGTPIGVSEISKKRKHVAGAVAVAHPGNPAAADSQIYVTLDRRPDLDGYYTVFGQIIAGAEVTKALQRGDLITRMYVK